MGATGCEVRVKAFKCIISAVGEADSSVSNYSLHIDQPSKHLFASALD